MKLEARYIFIYMWFFPGQALPSTPVGQPSPETRKAFLTALPRDQLLY